MRIDGLMHKGCAEGRSHFAGSLRVSLRYIFEKFPFLARIRPEPTEGRGLGGRSKEVFSSRLGC